MKTVLASTLAMIAMAGIASSAGCRREHAPPPATATAAPTAATEAKSGAVTGAAFVGSFEGKAPCADCPGIDTTLALAADGSYEAADRYEGRGSREETGTWAARDGDIVLIPAGNGSQQRRLRPVGNDALLPLDGEGRPITNAPVDMTLRRVLGGRR